MTFEEMRDIIVETLSCDAEDVTMEATLAEDLGADSLAAVELSMALEEASGVTIEDEDLPLPGSPEHLANVSLYFERNGLNIRASYNYAGDFIDEFANTPFEDSYYDKVNYLDANISYTFAKHYTVYGEANNLLNQPLRYYQGSSDLTKQVEYYGPKFNIGFKINF